MLGAELGWWEPGTFSGFWYGLIELLAGVAVVVVAGFGVWVAWRGLKTWQKQMLGSSEYALALRLLKMTFTLQAELKQARNLHGVYVYGEPIANSDDAREAWAKATTEHERIGRGVRAVFLDWDAVHLEAKAMWRNKDLKDAIEGLELLYQQYLGAVLSTINRMRQSRAPSSDIEDIIRSPFEEGKKDVFNRGLDAAVKSIENELMKYLPSRTQPSSPW